MILSLVVIGLVGGIAYVWASRGFFSALVHMVCVLVAGAIAFGVWEPLAYFILSKDVPAWVVDMTWGVSLGVPFAALLALLRLSVDKVLGANAELDPATNLVGGGICGAVSGTVSVGILVISMSFLRLGVPFMGYQPVGFETNGSVVRESSLIFPADKITAGLYSFMSKSTLRTGTPMATWRPDLAYQGHLLRTNFNDGGAKHTLRPNAFELAGRYTVGQSTPVPMKDLQSDSFPPIRSQTVTQFNGDPADSNSYIEGMIVQFKPGAREKEGRIVIGNAQVRLVCEPADEPGGAPLALHPFAMISQAEGNRLDLGRWRFERPEIFIASVGGSAEATMAFEFMVPKTHRPLALEVKGVRTLLSDKAVGQQFSSTAQRDSAVRSGMLLTGAGAGGGGQLDRSGAVVINPQQSAPDGMGNELLVSGGLPGGVIIVKDRKDGLEIDDTNKIIQGVGKFRNADLDNNRIAPRNLQVREVAATEDTKVVTLRVGGDSRVGLLTQAAVTADLSKTPVLIDEQNQRYVAIGYVYQDATETHVSVSPGQPIRTVSELPNGGPTMSRPDQKFTLIFRVSQGVKIKYFALGDTVIGEFTPAADVQ